YFHVTGVQTCALPISQSSCAPVDGAPSRKVGNMKVIFLAAGQGTRLRPLTDDRPKCMVPFLGKPLIERDIETLRLCGVNDILVIGGYRAEKLEGLGVEIVLNPRFETTNMVQTLFSARAHFPTDTGLII